MGQNLGFVHHLLLFHSFPLFPEEKEERPTRFATLQVAVSKFPRRRLWSRWEVNATAQSFDQHIDLSLGKQWLWEHWSTRSHVKWRMEWANSFITLTNITAYCRSAQSRRQKLKQLHLGIHSDTQIMCVWCILQMLNVYMVHFFLQRSICRQLPIFTKGCSNIKTPV